MHGGKASGSLGPENEMLQITSLSAQVMRLNIMEIVSPWWSATIPFFRFGTSTTNQIKQLMVEFPLGNCVSQSSLQFVFSVPCYYYFCCCCGCCWWNPRWTNRCVKTPKAHLSPSRACLCHRPNGRGLGLEALSHRKMCAIYFGLKLVMVEFVQNVFHHDLTIPPTKKLKHEEQVIHDKNASSGRTFRQRAWRHKWHGDDT